MLDIDHFKMINDSYGHKFGDFVLKKFAQLIKYNIRKIDIPGRYGGEEFLIILPNTDLHGSTNVAEKLRIRCAGREVQIADNVFKGRLAFRADFRRFHGNRLRGPTRRAAPMVGSAAPLGRLCYLLRSS